tara:strand:- start:574 stop:846 length:273 start_codon:yes stop_codon:yes gene_type:complete
MLQFIQRRAKHLDRRPEFRRIKIAAKANQYHRSPPEFGDNGILLTNALNICGSPLNFRVERGCGMEFDIRPSRIPDERKFFIHSFNSISK